MLILEQIPTYKKNNATRTRIHRYQQKRTKWWRNVMMSVGWLRFVRLFDENGCCWRLWEEKRW